MLLSTRFCCSLAVVGMMTFSLPKLLWSLPTVGSVPQTSNPKTDIRNPQNWVGKKFVLLEQSKHLQHFGYQSISIHEECRSYNRYADPSKNNPELEDDLGSLLYDKFAGDILTVTEVTAKPDSTEGLPKEYGVVFNDDNKSIPLYADTVLGRIDDIAPVEELPLVKKAWLGKTIWSKSRILWQYNSEEGRPTYITIPLGERLQVVDVSWGSESDFPVWVIVKRGDGETGYYEIAGTPVNKDADLYDIRAYWRNNFYDENPRNKYNWSQAVWDKVSHGEVALGMTYDQVELALDEPDHINRDVYPSGATAQWVYKHKYVYFSNRKVKAIQDR